VSGEKGRRKGEEVNLSWRGKGERGDLKKK